MKDRVSWIEILVAASILVILLCITASYGFQDLPVKPVRLGDPEIPIQPDGDDGDDPRDTPPPTIYGEEIPTENDTLIYVLDVSGSMYVRQGASMRISSSRS